MLEGRKNYIAYYYDNTKEQFPGVDSNELTVNGKFVGMITSCRTSHDLKDLQPESETEELILLLPVDSKEIDIVNFNPCPDDPDDRWE